MKRAKLYKKLKNKLVECQACFWHCKIPSGETGICGVRENRDGNLYLLVFGQAIGLSPDPIEKKPLFHFLPGSRSLSFGTLGCNFDCAFCQNWFQSQSPKKQPQKQRARLIDQYSDKFSPKEIVALAKELNCQSIAYTYNEPAVFVEYAYETMRLAKKTGLKNIFVSNGFESKEAFELVKDYLDAINIDLKSFKSSFYQKICQGKLEPVLENIEKFFKAGVWLEITTLVIPGENDSEEELTKIAKFIKNISPDVPWHLSAFHPEYRMKDKQPTSTKKLLQARKIGQKAGLRYIYLGNVWDLSDKYFSSLCPKCKKLLIHRDAQRTVKITGLKDGQCSHCSQKIAGVWR